MAAKKVVSDEEVAEVLDKALRLMNNNGRHWIKGFFKKKRDGEQCYCSIGAIREVCPGRDKQAVRNAAYIALSDAIGGNFYGYGPNKIMSWNDNPNTTWKGVVSKFKLAHKHALARAKKKAKT